jgi:ABC-2 type transport system ATP-binding protein
MKEQHGMSVVLCSHLLRDVEEVCDEVVIMKDGNVVHHADLEAERLANKRFVELEVSGDDSELLPALQAAGADGVNEGLGRWRIVLAADFDMAGLWKLLAAQSLDVRKLTHRRDTLEEIFLKAVGHIRHTPGEAAAEKEVPAHGRL